MTQPKQLTIDELTRLVSGEGAAFRLRTRLQPAGGPGDKLFPPTYATGDRVLKYATEPRRVSGEDVEVVLLDSVASQANRIEEALFRVWDEENWHFPVIISDFRGEKGIEDLDRISSLHAPHRVADALLRDSVTSEGVLFRDTPLGRAFTEANAKNATAVYKACPTALVFGVWDSTGPKGGLGSKFQRALVSEIVGINVKTGKKVGSRIDPAAIQANVRIYHSASNHADWTTDEQEAEKDKKGQPVVFSRSGDEAKKKGNPSAINHSNIAPSVDEWAGGVTIDYAEQTTVLSLVALRRLRFQNDVGGKALELAKRPAAEAAARAALAALALAGIAVQRAEGYDLRSRCALVPESPALLEAVNVDGTATAYALDKSSAKALLDAAVARASELGFGWERQPIALMPAPKLAQLIRKSRDAAAESAEG